jgi:hypothetical protein
VGDSAQVKKLTGEIWAEILSKVRGSGLSVADKVQAMDFVAAEATKLADSVRHGDHDGKIGDQAKIAAEAARTAAAETNQLMQLIRESRLHKPQAPGQPDLGSVESTMEQVRTQMKKLAEYYESLTPSIVDRVGAIALQAALGPATTPEDEDLPF